MAGSYKLLIFIVVISKCIAEEETRCSKYHFEEKVLEKLVRMEHSNGIMMDNFKQVATQVKESLETMKREFEEMKRQAEKKIEQCGLMIKDYVKRPPQAFSAFWLSNETPEVGEALVFTRILANENDAYDKHTGEYTVPVNGTYLFLSTLCTRAAQWINVKFFADHEVIGAFRAADRDWDLCTSSSATSNLQKGMKVKIVVHAKDSGAIFTNDEDYYHSSFSGHLIK